MRFVVRLAFGACAVLSTAEVFAAYDYSEGFVRLQTSGAFFTNAISAAEGWAPSPVPYQKELWTTSNYVVNAKLNLYSTGLGEYNGKDLFGGKTLIVDHPNAQVGPFVKSSKEVYFADLVLRQGRIYNQSASTESNFGGKITVENYPEYNTSVTFDQGTGQATAEDADETTNPMRLKAEMRAVSGNNVALTCESGWSSGKGGSDSRWYTRNRTYRFEGDCSKFLASVGPAKWHSIVVLGCADFGGSVALENLGRLSVSPDAPSSVVVHGTVTMSDAWLKVPDGKSLSVRGVTSAYAASSTYTYSGTGINAYTGLADAYTPTHAVKWQKGSFGVNAITVGTDSTLTIGDASFDATLLDLSAGGTVVITNSLSVLSPVEVKPSAAMPRQVLLALPLGKGTLSGADFRLADGLNPLQYELAVESDGDWQCLVCGNLNPTTMDLTTGYVVMTNTESSNADRRMIDGEPSLSFSGRGWWSNDCPPQSNTNYFTNGKVFRFESKTFGGRSLTVNASQRVDTFTGTCTIDDLRVIPNGLALFKGNPQFNPANSTLARTYCGKRWTFLTTEASPFSFLGSPTVGNNGSTHIVQANIFGHTDACIVVACQDSKTHGELPVEVRLLGDASAYFGLIRMLNSAKLCLGNAGLGGTVRMEAPDDVLTTAATNGACVRLPRLATLAAATVEVPAANELAVTEGLSLSDVLTKTGPGALAVGGTSATTGGSLLVAEGDLKPLSGDAVGGLPVAFAAGAGVRLDWTPSDPEVAARGLDLTASAFTVAGSTLSFAFDLGGAIPVRTRKVLCTVADADAPKLRGRIVVRKPARGFAATVGYASNGVTTTFYADVSETGLAIIFR